MTDAVEARNVSKSFRIYHEKNATLKSAVLRGRRAKYEDFQALDDVSLTIPEGSTFGLIGENGSGKSTLLKCMAKILRPDTGSVETRGKVSALLELGAGFHGELSGRENVYLNGSILGLSKRGIDDQFDEIVEFAGGDVPRFIDNPVKNYSSGMFVRLGFAIAINVQPDVLLVDEILAVGDEDFQRKCMEKFNELRKSGRTVVIVSHALDVVRSLCDEAAWLEHGKLLKVDKAGHVVDAYLDAVADERAERLAVTNPTEARRDDLLGRVQLLDPDGRPTTVLRASEPGTIRVEVECGATGQSETLRLEIYRTDGSCVSQVSTRESPVQTGELTGRQWIDYQMDSVLMAPDMYNLSIVLVKRDGRGEWARINDALHFEVVPGRVRHGGGFMMLGGGWSADPVGDHAG